MGSPPTASTDPTGGKSKARTFKPTGTDKVSLGSKDFGSTAKLAAFFTFGARKVKGVWRFNLLKLTVKVGSAVQPENFRINIESATDSDVTKESYPHIVRDLAPNRSVTMGVRVAGRSFKNKVPNYSMRKKYWNHRFVVEHEAFHRRDWIEHYRKELIRAEKEVWGHKLAGSAARDQVEAVRKASKTLDPFMIGAFKRTVDAYAPAQETRAYAAGAPDYQKLVDAIRARAKKEGW